MITHYMLENSRAIRVEWALRELGLEHDTKCYKRVNGKKAPPEMKQESGTSVGKSPALRDGDLLIVESSAILTYLAEKYDKSGRLLPGLEREQDRVDTFAWVGFAEGALICHALPITYAAWFIPDEEEKARQGFYEKLKPNIINDLDCVEAELKKNVEQFGEKNGQGAFLVGQELTIADIQVAFSVEYIFTHPTLSKGLQDEIRRFVHIKAWLRGLEARPQYKEATKVADYVFTLPDDL
ncbi:BQ2448_6855 [Microbotryum intermedium]|uniref:BQ2448_6855 protein n=1 Tax=Microbotryum intermedium TaxID=269621 RepID=A0A238FGJ6_9BASI|nr:BQ2448_6855 [Microbotryum intermedium]